MSDTIFIYLIVSSLTKKQREVRYLHWKAEGTAHKTVVAVKTKTWKHCITM
jgi:hypothetical protein